MVSLSMRILTIFMITILVLVVDFASGPDIQFPIAYVVPVLLASWYSSRTAGIVIAAILSIARLAIYPLWGDAILSLAHGINLIIRLIVLVGLAILVNHTVILTRELKQLKGILPICSSCKKIRTDAGQWEQVESYISSHSEAEFSHGLCSDCAAKLYPRYFKKE